MINFLKILIKDVNNVKLYMIKKKEIYQEEQFKNYYIIQNPQQKQEKKQIQKKEITHLILILSF